MKGDRSNPPASQQARRRAGTVTETDGAASYTLAIAARREEGVRAGRFKPTNEDEERQAREGIVPTYRLDCVQRGQQ